MTRSRCQNQWNETFGSVGQMTPGWSKSTTRTHGRNFQLYGSCRTTLSSQKTLHTRQQSHSNMTRSRVQSTTIIQKEIFASLSTFHPSSTIITFQICFILVWFVTNWWLSNYLKISSWWGIYPSLRTTSRSRTLHLNRYSQEGTTCHYPSKIIHAKNNDRLDQLSRRSRILF